MIYLVSFHFYRYYALLYEVLIYTKFATVSTKRPLACKGCDNFDTSR
jgi:hypothetical protein